MKTIRILMIDDHPLILDGYTNTILNMEIHYDIKLETVSNCDQVLELIKRNKQDFFYDIIFLDINLPSSTDNIILSGEDLGVFIRKKFPQIKIMVLTSFTDNIRLQNILASINPEGFLIKNETTAEILKCAIESIIHEASYFSKTITKLMRNHFFNDIILDQIDRSILFQLSQGAKTKDLPNYINLSLRAIENRKRRLKETFGVEQQSDRHLLDRAKEIGFV